MSGQLATTNLAPIRLWWLGLPVVAVLLATALGAADVLARPGAAAETVSAGRVAVGAPAPDFGTVDLGGATVRLSSFRGRAVLVSFWATWCTVCQDELPAIQAVTDRYKSARVTVLLVDFGETDRAALKSFLARLGVHLGSALDPAETIARAYRVVGLPVSFLVAPSGDLTYLHTGSLGASDLEAALAPIA